MKTAIFVACVVLGVVVGWLWSLGGSVAARLVMIGICAVAGAAVGGALTRLGTRPRRGRRSGRQSLDDWSDDHRRDEDHARASNGAPVDPGPHMFDPDRLQ